MNVDREDLSADFAELLAALPEGDRGKKIVRVGETAFGPTDEADGIDLAAELAELKADALRRASDPSDNAGPSPPGSKSPGAALPRSDDVPIGEYELDALAKSYVPSPAIRSNVPRAVTRAGRGRPGKWDIAGIGLADAAASMSAYGFDVEALDAEIAAWLDAHGDGDGEAGEPAFGLGSDGGAPEVVIASGEADGEDALDATLAWWMICSRQKEGRAQQELFPVFRRHR